MKHINIFQSLYENISRIVIVKDSNVTSVIHQNQGKDAEQQVVLRCFLIYGRCLTIINWWINRAVWLMIDFIYTAFELLKVLAFLW